MSQLGDGVSILYFIKIVAGLRGCEVTLVEKEVVLWDRQCLDKRQGYQNVKDFIEYLP